MGGRLLRLAFMWCCSQHHGGFCHGSKRQDTQKYFKLSDFPFVYHASTASLDHPNFLENSVLQGDLFFMQGSHVHRLRLRRGHFQQFGRDRLGPTQKRLATF